MLATSPRRPTRPAYHQLGTTTPDGLRSVPVAKIIQLRKDHRAEFNAFTQTVDQAAADLREQVGGIEDRAAFEHHLRLTFDESIAVPLEGLRKAMSGLNLKTSTAR